MMIHVALIVSLSYFANASLLGRMNTEWKMTLQMDLETYRIPVFCTANVSLELLEDFTASIKEPAPDDGLSLPTIMTSTNFDEQCIPRLTPPEAWIKPFLEKGSPYLGWTPMEIRNFYVNNAKTESDFLAWPLATFGILDKLSVLDEKVPTHRTILLCSFMPDFLEGASVWLKTCRVKFEMFASEVCRLETFVTRPSELGKDTALSFAMPLIFVGRQGARERVSYGVENEFAYSEEHMAMQGSDKGCVRYLVRPAPPNDVMGDYGRGGWDTGEDRM